MKPLAWFGLFLFSATFLHGQNLDGLMMHRQFDCPDVASECSFLFSIYLKENNFDSAGILIRYWENKCGPTEPVRRAKILLALVQHDFHDSLLAHGMVANLLDYRDRLITINSGNPDRFITLLASYGYVPVGREFDRVTMETARKLRPGFPEETIEYQLCAFYGNQSDSLFTRLLSPPLSNSVLAGEYRHEVVNNLNLKELHISWITGIWIPSGSAARLGVHPEFGVQLGMKNKKMNYDLTLCFRVGNTPSYYYARRTKTDDSLVATRFFFGGYIGLDAGYDLIVRKRHEFQLLAGAGIDGFDAIREDPRWNIPGESVLSYNFNFGFEYRFYLSTFFYLGLQWKYNFVDYSLSRVVDFSGNPVTLRFIIGGVSNPTKSRNLNILQYRWRK